MRQNAIMELLAYSAKDMVAIITVIVTMAIAVCILSANIAQNHHISQKWIISSETQLMDCLITELSQHRRQLKQH